MDRPRKGKERYDNIKNNEVSSATKRICLKLQGKKGKAGKAGKFQGDIFSESAMENAYYVCHNLMDVLKLSNRVFPIFSTA